MDDPQREALDIVRPKLVEGLQLNSVLRGLLKGGIFTRTLNFEVMKQPPPERVTKLLDLLCTRGNRALKVFCNVLKKEFEVELAYELQRASYVKEEEFYV